MVVTVAVQFSPFRLGRFSKLHLLVGLSNSCCYSFHEILRAKHQPCTSSQLLNSSHQFFGELHMLVIGDGDSVKKSTASISRHHDSFDLFKC